MRRIEIVNVLALCFLMLASLVSAAAPVLQQSSFRTAHDPILIDSNADFIAINGVSSGSGTLGDPYVIEDLEIDATNVTGIKIANTDAYIVIRNVGIDAVITDNWLGVSPYAGVLLSNVRNCRLENIEISNKAEGVLLDACSLVEIKEVAVSGHGNGIKASNCQNLTISGNRIAYAPYSYESGSRYGYGQGIQLQHTSNVTVTENTLTENYQAIMFDHCFDVVVEANHISARDEYYRDWDPMAIYFDLRYFNGIGLSCSNNSTITQNDISDCFRCVQMYLSSNATLTGNNFSSYNVWTIQLILCADVNIANNDVANNHYGICLAGATDCCIYHNNLFRNFRLQAEDAEGTNNSWDSGYPGGGNFWSDYNGTDRDEDGIGDAPYAFEGGQDNYPLMEPYTESVSSGFAGEKLLFLVIGLVIAVATAVALVTIFVRTRSRSTQQKEDPGTKKQV